MGLVSVEPHALFPSCVMARSLSLAARQVGAAGGHLVGPRGPSGLCWDILTMFLPAGQEPSWACVGTGVSGEHVLHDL